MKETREESDGVANVVSLVRDDDVDVIFGSPSSRSKSLKIDIKFKTFRREAWSQTKDAYMFVQYVPTYTPLLYTKTS